MPRSDFKFSFPKRVRYADIDAQAIVFNSRYLEYLDVGVTEYWRAVGIALTPQVGALEFNVVKAVIEYKAPIRLDEMIDLWLRMERIGRSSMTTFFEFHGAGKEELRARGELVNVHVDLATGESQKIPDEVVRTFEQYEGRRLRTAA